MGRWPSWWYLLVWVILGFLALLSGIVSFRFDIEVVGVMFMFAATSVYLTSYVKSKHKAKKTLEVIFMLLTFGVVVYGYITTRSLILGVITLFIVALFLIAFVASWLLPAVRSKIKKFS